jgi:hypothetical protein
MKRTRVQFQVSEGTPQATYNKLKREVLQLGFVCLGSIVRRRVRCGKPGCACRRSKAHGHGPYYYWTRKVNGKTETRMLTEAEVSQYNAGIRNHRRLENLIERMREVSLMALQARARTTRAS